MILKEFDLDLPYYENPEIVEKIMKEKNILYDEATKLDYEKNWKDKMLSFRLETRCISSMFERLFTKYKTDDCWKILVECVDRIYDNRILDYSGVYTVQVSFKYKEFIYLTDHEKKVKTLELLMKGIKEITEYKNWPFEPFEKVYQSIIDLNYVNEWTWGKEVKSPDKKYLAEVQCFHDIQEINIYVVIKDMKGNFLEKRKLLSEEPDEFFFNEHLGKLRWISNNEVALFNKEGNRSWNYKIS